jgi:hypothetical protein
MGMDIAIMIEGQNGLNWARWQRIGRSVGLAEAVVGFDRR